MTYCKHCGTEVNENAVVCVNCGCPIQQANNAPTNEIDNSVNVGLVILAFLIPLFGIIYWPVKAKDRPKCARACGVASISSWVIGIMVALLAGL